MGWTSRSEKEPCCPGPNGTPGSAVAHKEKVARLLHSGIIEPGDPLKRTELFPHPKHLHTDACGEADGTSIVRRDDLTDDDLREKATELANLRPGRTQEGAIVAEVAELRRIRIPGKLGQVVYVYDDPKPDDMHHAVIRGLETLDRPDQSLLRDLIREKLSERVQPC